MSLLWIRKGSIILNLHYIICKWNYLQRMNKISRLNILLVGSSGFLGSVLRDLVGLVTQFSIRSDSSLYRYTGHQCIGLPNDRLSWQHSPIPQYRYSRNTLISIHRFSADLQTFPLSATIRSIWVAILIFLSLSSISSCISPLASEQFSQTI